ncbi:5022_t:CDS:2 [Ambispora gerdemannii]|uniref:5022_t:CDS:1 n=1 Tax=Ambispora gerdemannii TaxID=144530 RepID=A0A9N9F2Z4_9GLOM|nr:5022_t:CDS:2 [Ambispora gerdemannii]
MSKNFERTMQVVNGYRKLAEEHNWKNSDQSIFPISNENIKKFMEYKEKTCSETSVKWYCDFLYKYEVEILPNLVEGAKSNVEINNDTNKNCSNSKKNNSLKTKEMSGLIIIEDSDEESAKETNPSPIVILSDDDDIEFDKLSMTYIEDIGEGKDEGKGGDDDVKFDKLSMTYIKDIGEGKSEGKGEEKGEGRGEGKDEKKGEGKGEKKGEGKSERKGKDKEVENINYPSNMRKTISNTAKHFPEKIPSKRVFESFEASSSSGTKFKEATGNLSLGENYYSTFFGEASGDDCNEEKLPQAEELPEFSTESAVFVPFG